VAMIPYQMDPKNFMDVYNAYKTAAPETANISIGLGIVSVFKHLMPTMNIIDILAILFSIFILYKLARNHDKTPKEKFIFYNAILFIIITTFYGDNLGGIRLMPFFFMIILLLSLAFSDIQQYSIFHQLKLRKYERKIFYIMMAVYIVMSIASLLPVTPYYLARTNQIYCTITGDDSCNYTPYPTIKLVSSELSKIMKDDETYYYSGLSENYMYTRSDDFYPMWQLQTYIQKEYKITPTIYDIIQTYNFNNRRIKYVVIPAGAQRPEEKKIAESIKPFRTVKAINIPVAYIYKVDDLQETQK